MASATPHAHAHGGPVDNRRFRVAWLGPLGTYGGVPVMAGVLANALADEGVALTCYSVVGPDVIPEALVQNAHVRLKVLHLRPRAVRPGIRRAMGSLLRRAIGETRLSWRLIRDHRQDPFDVIFVCGHAEAPLLDLARSRLPPLVAYPCTSARSELRWIWKDRRDLGRMRTGEAILTQYIRAAIQRRALRRRALVLGPSQVFLDQLTKDAGLDHSACAVLRHPIDLETFFPTPDACADARSGVLFAARRGPRKGLRTVVELSHLLPASPRWSLIIAGDQDLQADASAVLDDLQPSTTNIIGNVPAIDMPALYRRCAAVLVPSMYEPGSLVLCEAVASGTPVVASGAVGPAEAIGEPAVWRFAPGDAGDAHRQISALARALAEDPAGVSLACRAAAEKLFAPPVVAARLMELLQATASTRAPRRSRTV